VRREIARYRKAAPKLLALGSRDWGDLVRAQVALIHAQREMKSMPTGSMVLDDDDARGGPTSGASAPHSTVDRINDARRIALAVNRAATFGLFRPKCLVKSRALRKLLDEAGVDGAQVKVGVQLVDGRFFAHAWVEYAGQVVGDDPAAVARFVPMPGIQVAALE
jgi:hypothetical protein